MNKFQLPNFNYRISKSGAKTGRFRRGFTLIELLMASAILMVLFGVFTTVFSSIIDAQLESTATSGVDQDGRYILARLAYDMQRASDIISPAAPSSTTQPNLTLRINAVDYIYDVDGNDNLLLTNDLGAHILNGYNTSVQNLTFQRIGGGGISDTVQVKFTITSRVQQANGPESRDFQTTLSIQ
jgi:prepilin-type N-terminal cleavage/methylation domain-containing protein